MDAEPITVWLIGDSLVHWLGEQVRNDYTLMSLREACNVQFSFVGKRGGHINDLPQLVADKIRTEGDLPHFIMIHIGSNDIADVNFLTKCLIFRVEQILNVVVGELFDLGIYTAGAHRFQGLIWSDILPRYRWTAFKDQKAAEAKRRWVNAAAAAVMTKAAFWSLKHDNFKAHLKINYRIPDPTHLSQIGNLHFYKELETFVRNTVASQWINTKSSVKKYAH